MLGSRCLQVKEARDNLEIVLHAMVDLFQEHLFLREGCPDSFLCLFTLGDVPHHQKQTLPVANGYSCSVQLNPEDAPVFSRGPPLQKTRCPPFHLPIVGDETRSALIDGLIRAQTTERQSFQFFESVAPHLAEPAIRIQE